MQHHIDLERLCVQDLPGPRCPPLDQHWWQDNGFDSERLGASSPLRAGSSPDTRLPAYEKGASVYCSKVFLSPEQIVLIIHLLQWLLHTNTSLMINLRIYWVHVCVVKPRPPAVSCAFIATGYFLPLPQVTSVQRHPEEGTEPWAS